MNQQWHLLLVTGNPPKASIVQGMPEENNIPILILNKLDSSYLSFGDIEVYVPMQFKETAKQLSDTALLN
jgi:hypothetical protein